MQVHLEPIAGWFAGAFMLGVAAVVAVYGKRFAEWIGTQIARGVIGEIGDALQPRWQKLLDPIYAELQIGEGAEKWPNGSDTLPKTMKTIYDRQAETYGMVRDMQRQLEQVLTARPSHPDEPEGTPEGF